MINVEKVPYKSIEVEVKSGKLQTISTGDKISFVVEDTGVLKQGTVTGFKGTKPEKVEIEFIPSDGKHKETWSVIEMLDGSLRLVEDEDSEEEDGEDEKENDIENDE